MNRFSTKALVAVLLVISLAAILMIGTRVRPGRPPSNPSSPTNRISRDLADQLARLEAREIDLNKTVWRTEILAQQCGTVVESIWDSLNGTTNKLDVAASLSVKEIVLGDWQSPESLPHGIEMRESIGKGVTLSQDKWHEFVERFQNAGWELVRTEFRQNQFEPHEDGSPKRSRFYFSAHLTNSGVSSRVILDGSLFIDWKKGDSPAQPPGIQKIDASELVVKSRTGEPPFQLILSEVIPPPQHSLSIDPLLVYDFDGDGLSEVLLLGGNLIFRRRERDRYTSEVFCAERTGLIHTGVIGDFDRDGSADVLAALAQGLALFQGTHDGVFSGAPRPAWTSALKLEHPMVLTCGDVDGDRDLDVYLGQYKVPYENGQLPTPFFDANDGHPSYLLLNDGTGKFADATVPAGLGDKRRRRCYSASLADLDQDHDLDLIVVSDFAGIDLFENIGAGRFQDVTSDWITTPRAFGMGHALSDFNSDGFLDLFMIGMTSPTADRLDHLDLRHPNAIEDPAMRSDMTYGNRLFIAGPEHGFRQTALSDSIARSGWSWGCGTFDFDNDGFVDVYIANGLESRSSVKDYESEYWLHDRHVGRSNSDSAVYLYFGAKFSRTRGRGESYGGYEKNRFYLNQKGRSFLEIAHLLGVALEEDSRNVVADDLDGDGRVDLLVTSFEAWPESKQTLRIYRNQLAGSGNWIGFRSREEGAGNSPAGSTVRVHCDGAVQARQIITGDSYRSQHSNAVHFGLGESTEVEKVEIIRPGGRTITLNSPAVNRYHWVPADSENTVPQ